MLCTVIDIRGDYAFVKYDDTGVVSEVALALPPPPPPPPPKTITF